MERDYWPNLEWKTSEAALKIDTSMISNNVNGIVVIRNGYLVFEKYYNGYGPDDEHHVASVTKSITSALIGIAIDKGYIKSIDEKVLSFFPEYTSSAADVRKRAVTLKHLLTMTAPFPFTWKPGGSALEPLDRLRRQKDWVKYTLDIMGQKGEFGEFQYCTAGAHLISAILTRTTGKCAREFANENLFHPIGMRVIPDPQMKGFGLDDVFGKNLKGWIHDPTGNTTGGWGITLTLRDMARFGFLYLNKGKWDNKQIVSESWVNESLKMNTNKYGYLWWLREENGIFAFMARGDGGNVICCIPEKDLVIAIASKIVSKPCDILPLIDSIYIENHSHILKQHLSAKTGKFF